MCQVVHWIPEQLSQCSRVHSKLLLGYQAWHSTHYDTGFKRDCIHWTQYCCWRALEWRCIGCTCVSPLSTFGLNFVPMFLKLAKFLACHVPAFHLWTAEINYFGDLLQPELWSDICMSLSSGWSTIGRSSCSETSYGRSLLCFTGLNLLKSCCLQFIMGNG